MIQRALITIIAAVTLQTQCMAWGQKGHDTICTIAEQHLTPHTRRHIHRLLNGHSIVYWANWLDNASHTPQYAYSLTWHYKNIDANQKYDDVPPFETGDIITAIDKQTTTLKGKTLSKEEEALALKILIHLMGDLHQPMHMGHKTDRGGNEVKIKFFGADTDLHTVWDTDLVEAAHRWSHTEWARQTDLTTKQTRKLISQGTPDDWARETHQITRHVYDITPEGTNISYDYVAAATPIIEQQLLKAGIRLAALLNHIY